MKVTIAGIGMGTRATLTAGVEEAIAGADLLVGAGRMLQLALDTLDEHHPPCAHPATLEEVKPSAIVEGLRGFSGGEGNGTFHVCVLCSGDVGFFSLARPLADAIRDGISEAEVTLLPGITTVQYLAARLGRTWQTCALASAHGRECDVVGLVISHEQVFLLTGGDETPATIVDTLLGAGLGDVEVTVAERLSYDDERITTASAAELSGRAFDSLSAVWIRRGRLCDADVEDHVGQAGIPDGLFIRGDAPMTKREVRSLIVSRLNPQRGEVIWDVGAGTGSVSVELASREPFAHVFAFEKDGPSADLVEQNRARFGAYNVTVVKGHAPEDLEGLPAPDAVFIGGTTGNLSAILDAVLQRNPQARIVATAVTLETVSQMTGLLEEAEGLGLVSGLDVIQVAVTRTREAGRYHLMTPESPIFLFSVQGAGGGGA